MCSDWTLLVWSGGAGSLGAGQLMWSGPGASLAFSSLPSVGRRATPMVDGSH